MPSWPASTEPTRRRRGARAALLGALLGVAAGFPVPDALAQTPVKVRSGLHDSYGRLVFDWPKAVRFDASVMDGQLVLRFDQPLAADLSGAAIRQLDGYIKSPTLSEDRRTVSFALVRPITIKSFTNERSAVIDMRPGAAADTAAAAAPVAAPPAVPAASTPATPASAAPTATAAAPTSAATASAAPAPTAPAPLAETKAPTLPIRIAQHDDHTRLVFDWPQSVDYRVLSEGGRAKVEFSRAAQVDPAALRNLPRSIAQPELIGGPASAAGLTFAIPRDAQLRHFRQGLSVVVDVMAPRNAVAAVAAPAAPTAIAPPAAPTAIAPPASPAAATPPAATPPAASAVAAVPPAQTAPAPAPGRPAQADLPTARNPFGIAAAAQEPKPIETKPATEETGPSVPVTLAGQRVRFTWRDQPAAAIFTRGGAAFVIFDKPARFDLSAYSNPKDKNRPPLPEPFPVAGGSGIRVPLAANLNVVPVRESDGWSLLFRPEPRRPQSAAPVTVDSAGEGPRVLVSMAGMENQLVVTDPERGEPMRVVPLRTAGLGVDHGRQFAQFDILPSNQGLIVVPRADGIDLRAAPNGIVVGGSQGVLVSRSGVARGAGSPAAAAFDLQRWLESDVDFIETRQALNRAVAEADPARRAAARFELAQFFLARNHAADAIGVISLIAADDRRYATDPALKALRGAARVMLDDGAAAKADLDDPLIANDTAALPWRAAAAGQAGKWAEADQLFRRAGQLAPSYPAPLRQKLLLLAAEAALNAGDSARVRSLLDNAMRGDVPATVRAQADFLRARALIASDDRRGGMPLLQRLATSPDRWSRAHGEFMLVEQQLAENAITPQEAIERLDRIRFAWSGDQLEYRLLRRLGELEIEHGDVRAGLTRLREAVQHFPTNKDENAAIQARMTEAFASLYDENGPRKLPPLTALSLYDDFRDLTPQGARGDKMIQNLADRLVAMDLLDRAGELLDYQIKNRLSGPEKARVGARLAVVDLLDRKPKAAIAALDETEVPKLPPELAATRRHLKARAVSETGDVKGGLALLDGDTSKEADQLRAEINVRAGAWGQAAQALDRLVGQPGEGVFDTARRRQILNLAIAYALAGDSEGLRSVRDRFGEKMTVGATKDAFGMVTSLTEGPSPINDKALTSRFADLQEFQQFMAGYREKLKGSSLSAIN